ncbi:MAG: hypothetical protein ACVCEJ_02980 [Candidatus Izemoplasmataceae bacterium]
MINIDSNVENIDGKCTKIVDNSFSSMSFFNSLYEAKNIVIIFPTSKIIKISNTTLKGYPFIATTKKVIKMYINGEHSPT